VDLAFFKTDDSAGIKVRLSTTATAIPITETTPTCLAGSIICVISPPMPTMVVIPVTKTGF